MKLPRLLRIASAAASATAAAGVAYISTPRRSREREGQVVLITGGSHGLGLALAQRYALSGARLVLVSRSLEQLNTARQSLLDRNAITSPDDVLLLPADLTDRAQASSIIAQTIDHFGRLDVLINNAGVIEVGPVEDLPPEAWDRAMNTHFFAPLSIILAALPYMLRHRAPGTPRPAIVNISSVGGKFAVPHLLPYVASKFALTGLSEGLHAELRHKGIRVTTVCPGLMRTGGHVHAKFHGQQSKESRWFTLSATTPVVASSVRRAANQIYDAVQAGRAEITISPQAWLIARLHGLCPETTQIAASYANEYILPNPLARDGHIREIPLQQGAQGQASPA